METSIMNIPQVIVMSLVQDRGRILMVKRGNAPLKGLWSLPGGHLEFGEKLEDGAVRETLEETGVSIKINGLVSFKNLIIEDAGQIFHFVVFCYDGVKLGGVLASGEDTEETKWIEINEVRTTNITPEIVDFLKMRDILVS